MSNINQEFYKKLSLEELTKNARISGIANNPDLQVVHDIITQHKTITDFGAGYGRVVQYVLDNTEDAKITAIENHPQYLHHLEKTYTNNPRVHINNTQITPQNSLEIAQQDVIFASWNFFTIFNQKQQRQLMQTTSQVTKANGYLLVDGLEDMQHAKGFDSQSEQKKDSIQIFLNDTPYILNKVDEKNLRNNNFFSYIEKRSYSINNSQRNVHVLQKN